MSQLCLITDLAVRIMRGVMGFIALDWLISRSEPDGWGWEDINTFALSESSVHLNICPPSPEITRRKTPERSCVILYRQSCAKRVIISAYKLDLYRLTWQSRSKRQYIALRHACNTVNSPVTTVVSIQFRFAAVCIPMVQVAYRGYKRRNSPIGEAQGRFRGSSRARGQREHSCGQIYGGGSLFL